MTEPIKAWWFGKTKWTLGYGDKRVIEEGGTLTHKGELRPCSSGLHASDDILDALSFRKGCFLWRVELSGERVSESSKHCSRSRKHLWCVDLSGVLSEFARLCALDVIDLWEAPVVVEAYLRTGDESLREEARDAAYAADAAAAAVYAANAAYAAAAADYAAYAAADAADAAAAANAADAAAAAYPATHKSQRSKQRKRLLRMIREECKKQGVDYGESLEES